MIDYKITDNYQRFYERKIRKWQWIAGILGVICFIQIVVMVEHVL